MDYDVIVVGVGGMGSAAADALASRGARVLAIERFGVAHDRGASHGRSRIVRQAYFESPAYIPLLRRAYALWDALPTGAGLHRVGCLVLGPSSSPVVTGAVRSAAVWEIPVEPMTAQEVAGRFPAFAPGPDDVAVLEPDAGFVRPEETVALLAGRARERGADIRTGVRVLGWDSGGRSVRVRTAEETFTARRLVLSAGAWTSTLAGSLGLPLHVERRVMHFFAPGGVPRRFAPTLMPTFIWDLASGDSIYGFPADGEDGVKVGFHNRGGPADPERPQPSGSAAEVASMREVLDARLPGVGDRLLRSVGCTYTLTPDHDFVLGPAPGTDGQVLVAAGFSGHGFKFVPVVGEVLADLALDGGSRFDLGFLAAERFLSR